MHLFYALDVTIASHAHCLRWLCLMRVRAIFMFSRGLFILESSFSFMDDTIVSLLSLVIFLFIYALVFHHLCLYAEWQRLSHLPPPPR